VTDQLLPIMGKDGVFFFQTAGLSVPRLDAAGFSRLFFARDGIARAWSQFMAGYGLILSPTWTQLPFEEGFDPASEDNVTAMIRPVLPANLIGLPSACVPAALDVATGLPIGVLITGRRMHAMECLDAAEAIEARFRLPTPIDPK
jgi:amidase